LSENRILGVSLRLRSNLFMVSLSNPLYQKFVMMTNRTRSARPALSPCRSYILIFFAGGFELEWVAKKAGRALAVAKNYVLIFWNAIINVCVFETTWTEL